MPTSAAQLVEHIEKPIDVANQQTCSSRLMPPLHPAPPPLPPLILQTSNPDVYAIGDVAAFPLQLTGGNLVRQEHVTCCRQAPKHRGRAAQRATGFLCSLPG